MADDFVLDFEELLRLDSIAIQHRVLSLLASEVLSELDLEELHRLQSIAKRPRVASLLGSKVLNLEKVEEAPAPVVPTPTPTPVPAKVSSSSTIIYSAVTSFGWDQDNDKVKDLKNRVKLKSEKSEA